MLVRSHSGQPKRKGSWLSLRSSSLRTHVCDLARQRKQRISHWFRSVGVRMKNTGTHGARTHSLTHTRTHHSLGGGFRFRLGDLGHLPSLGVRHGGESCQIGSDLMLCARGQTFPSSSTRFLLSSEATLQCSCSMYAPLYTTEAIAPHAASPPPRASTHLRCPQSRDVRRCVPGYVLSTTNKARP